MARRSGAIIGLILVLGLCAVAPGRAQNPGLPDVQFPTLPSLDDLIGLLPDALEQRLADLRQRAEQEIRDALDNATDAFDKFKGAFNRTYRDAAEELRRKQIFEDNLQRIKNITDQAQNTFFLKIGPFADLTKQEFISSYLGLNKTNLVVDNTNLDDTTVSAAGGAPPQSVNWVSQRRVVPIKNQGQCGDCWIFSTTSAIETASAILTGELYSLSEQQTLDCGSQQAVGGNGCNGGQIEWTTEYAMSNGGLTAESGYPYRAQQNPSCNTAAANWKVVQIQGYKWITPQSSQAMQAAVSRGSVVVGIAGGSDVFQFYGGGVFSQFGACCTSADCQDDLNHAVTVVGYDATAGYWILRNSWGDQWGEGGYMRASMATPSGFPSGICGMLTYGIRPIKNEPNTITGTPPPGAQLVNLAAGSAPPANCTGPTCAGSMAQLSVAMLVFGLLTALSSWLA